MRARICAENVCVLHVEHVHFVVAKRLRRMACTLGHTLALAHARTHARDL